MNLSYMQQLVYCSRREGRAFMREIAIAPANALVTRVEALPSGYEFALARMRNPREPVVDIPADRITYARGVRGCPFCGNRCTFHCVCGTVSCMSCDDTHHCCPTCQEVSGTEPIKSQTFSPSGLIGVNVFGQLLSGGGQAYPPAPLPAIQPPPRYLPEPDTRTRKERMDEGALRVLLQKALAGETSPRPALPAPAPKQIEAPRSDRPSGEGPVPGGGSLFGRWLLPPGDPKPADSPSGQKLLPPAGPPSGHTPRPAESRWSDGLDPDVAARLAGQKPGDKGRQDTIDVVPMWPPQPAGPSSPKPPESILDPNEWPPRSGGRSTRSGALPETGAAETRTVRRRKFQDRPREKGILKKFADKVKDLIE